MPGISVNTGGGASERDWAALHSDLSLVAAAAQSLREAFRELGEGVGRAGKALAPGRIAGGGRNAPGSADAAPRGRGQAYMKPYLKALRKNTQALKKLKGRRMPLDFDVSELGELAEGAGVTVGVDFVPDAEAGAGNPHSGGLLGWLQSVFDPGVDAEARLRLLRDGWSSVGEFVGTALTVLLGLGRSGWTSLGGFVGTALTVLLGLGRSGWTSLGGFLGLAAGNLFKAFVGLFKSGDHWNADANRALNADDRSVTTTQNLSRGSAWDSEAHAAMTAGDRWVSTWRSLLNGRIDGTASDATYWGDRWVSTWRNLFSGVVDGTAHAAMTAGDRTVTTTENLKKGDKWNSDAEAGVKARDKTTTTKVNLVAGTISDFASKIGEGIKKAIGSVKGILGLASGGVVSPGGRVLRFAAGGAVTGSGAARWWRSVPKYAAGTRRAHGTVFVAGEAGPEIVGHVNGRTEILNRSQLAQAIHGAVASGMGQAVNALARCLTGQMILCANAITASVGALSAVRGLNAYPPALASGAVLPYSATVQADRTAEALRQALDANNEDLIRAMVSAIGNAASAVVAAVQAQDRGGRGDGLTSRLLIDDINRRAQMFAASPLKGV